MSTKGIKYAKYTEEEYDSIFKFTRAFWRDNWSVYKHIVDAVPELMVQMKANGYTGQGGSDLVKARVYNLLTKVVRSLGHKHKAPAKAVAAPKVDYTAHSTSEAMPESLRYIITDPALSADARLRMVSAYFGV